MTRNLCQPTDLPARTLGRLDDRTHAVNIIPKPITSSFSNITLLSLLYSFDHWLILLFTLFSPRSNTQLLVHLWKLPIRRLGGFSWIFWLASLGMIVAICLLFLCLRLALMRLFFIVCTFIFHTSLDLSDRDPLSDSTPPAPMSTWKKLCTTGSVTQPINIPKSFFAG